MEEDKKGLLGEKRKELRKLLELGPDQDGTGSDGEGRRLALWDGNPCRGMLSNDIISLPGNVDFDQRIY